jgi:hypothetical protein
LHLTLETLELFSARNVDGLKGVLVRESKAGWMHLNERQDCGEIVVAAHARNVQSSVASTVESSRVGLISKQEADR